MLAVVYFMNYYRHYLVSRFVTVRTDHGSLRWLHTMRNPSGQMARWIEKLAPFHFEIVHRPGKQHLNADALSRIRCGGDCTQCQKIMKNEPDGNITDPLHLNKVRLYLNKVRFSTEDAENGDRKHKRLHSFSRRITRKATEKAVVEQIPGLWDIAEVAKAVKQDPDLKRMLEWHVLPSLDEIRGETAELRFYHRLRSSWKIDNNQLIWYKWIVSADQHQWKLVIPKSLQPVVLRAVHNAPSGGHFGIKRSIHSLLQLPVYWFGFRKDMELHCRKCDECLRCKPILKHVRSPMKSFIAGEPLQRMAVDILGKLHTTKNGNQYIAVCMDYFTKWVAFLPMPNHTASTIAQALIDKVFTVVGIPTYLHSDKGTDFCSNIFRAVCDTFGIDKTTTSPWRPQSDGMVERCNRTLESLLKLYVNLDQDNWDTLLPVCAMAYNASVHSSTGYSPFFLMFGRNMRLPLELVLPPPDEAESTKSNEDDVHSFVHNMARTFEHVFALNRKHLQAALDNQKRAYEKRKNEYKYKPGDGVWLYNPRRKVGRSPKLDSPWEPVPYTVVKVLGDVLCLIKKSIRGKARVVHKDKLLPVRGDHDGKWVFQLPSKSTVIKPNLLDEHLFGLESLFKVPENEVVGSPEVSSSEGVDREPVVVENVDSQVEIRGPITRSRQKKLDSLMNQ